MVANIEEIKKIYNYASPNYNLRYKGAEGLYHKLLEADLLFSMLDIKGKTVLDIGTGTGRFVFEFADEATQVIGIDISDRMIEIANSKIGIKNNIEFYIMDARRLNFPTDCFDCVTSVGTFEFTKDLSSFLKEIHRVLKPKGQFIFSCFNKNSLFHILPRRHITEAHFFTDIRKALEDKGFCLKRVKSTFFIPFQIVWKIHSILVFAWARYLWLKVIILFELFFLKFPFFRNKGMQFIILCEKI